MEVPHATPEHDRSPKQQAFDLGAMTVDQVKFLNAAIEEKLARMIEQEPEADVRYADQLVDMLQAGLDGQAGTEHGRELLIGLKSDDDGHNQLMAGVSAAAFAPYDYRLARDVVLDVYFGQAPDVGLADFRERLTPEERADFDAEERRRYEAEG
jgi:hypothetical protein